MINEQALNKKLAEWRWPDAQVYIPRVPTEIRVRIEGQTTQYDLFTQSLDACFKWLTFEFNALWIIRNPGKVQYCWGYVRGEVNDVICWSKELPIEECLSPIAEHQALSLCLAIEKLIGKEEE